MNDNKITIEQTVDILIEGARKTSNTPMLDCCKPFVLKHRNQ